MPDPESYPDLVARLARRHDELAAERAGIATWHAQQQAAAQSAVDRAAEAVARAGAEVEEARSIVEHTDLEVHRLWRRLEDRVGRLGPSPDPSPLPAPSPVTGSEDDPDHWLRQVAERLDRPARTGRELPGWVSPLLVIFGVVGTGAGYAAAQGARWAALRIGGDFGVFAPVLEQIVLLLAPFLGLLPAKVVADRTEGRLDGGRIAAVLVVGLLTLGVLVVARR